MQLEFALFCGAAEVSDMGLIDILRGGYDIVSASEFPAQLSRMTLVVRILCQPNELNREHTLVSQIIDPNGHVLALEMTAAFTTPLYPGNANHSNRTTLKLDYGPIQFVETGDYTFRFLVNGAQIGESKLEVKRKEMKAE
jgi:hypothetical protein